MKEVKISFIEASGKPLQVHLRSVNVKVPDKCPSKGDISVKTFDDSGVVYGLQVVLDCTACSVHSCLIQKEGKLIHEHFLERDYHCGMDGTECEICNGDYDSIETIDNKGRPIRISLHPRCTTN